MAELYNPLDKSHLAESIGRAMQDQTIHSLPPDAFTGAGVYAIYYAGEFACYAAVSAAEPVTPIYVGIALPEGGRTGAQGLTTSALTTRKLSDRLRQHSRSIEATDNLALEDFRCRYLLLDDIWIPLAEAYLIQFHRPIWNTDIVSGFGIHAPGKGRTGQKRSLWDEIHPGRAHAAERPAATMNPGDISRRIERYLRGEEPAELKVTGVTEGGDSAPEAD